MRLSGGITENGIVVGNVTDKYGSQNPLVRGIMRGFESTLTELVHLVAPAEINEVGCGEGYWVLRWREEGFAVRGSDVSHQVINLAQKNALDRGVPTEIFATRSIYDLDRERDAADLVVCCEVLEHLEWPEKALMALQPVVRRHLILSVPREPLWRILNLARGQYVTSLGNTPGHIQHWSTSRFIRLVSAYFEVMVVRTPVPWTILLCGRRA